MYRIVDPRICIKGESSGGVVVDVDDDVVGTSLASSLSSWLFAARNLMNGGDGLSCTTSVRVRDMYKSADDKVPL